MRKIDLTGKRFGRLLVLGESGRDKWKKILWKCKCDCGEVKIIVGESLKSGKTSSCGCLGAEIRSASNTKNCKGERFGRLIALKDVGRDKHGSAIWECLCDCGNTTTVTTCLLSSGKTKSCGCLSRENIINYNKSEKHKLTTVKSNRNREWSMESRQKSSMTKLKQSKKEWNGFTTPTHKRIYNWLKYVVGWYDDVKKRDSYVCQECGDDRGGNLNSHHIIPLKYIITSNNIKSIDDAKRCKILYDLKNGITLCEKCHIKLHAKLRSDNKCAPVT